MKCFLKENLTKILEEHKIWLNNPNDENGFKADLRYADLRYADLRGADLRYAYLRGANLHDADLRGVDLRGVDLRDANLRGSNLRGADLRYAYLRGADLHDAINTPYIPLACPSEGSFVGWKKAIFITNDVPSFSDCHGASLVKLEILADAKRSSATTLKCRCDKAKVLEIIALDDPNIKITEAVSQYDHQFVYRVGEIVSVDNYDDDRWNECAPGIHFFINKQDAIDY